MITHRVRCASMQKVCLNTDDLKNTVKDMELSAVSCASLYQGLGWKAEGYMPQAGESLLKD